MVWFDPSPTISYPALSWEQAMVLLYHFEQGKDTADRMVRWQPMVSAMYDRHGFVAYDAASSLRSMESPLLLFEPNKPHSETHRLPEACFRDQAAFFRAINEAEHAHNAMVAEKKAKHADDEQKGKKLDPFALKTVPITPMVLQAVKPTGHDYAAAQAPATLRIGDVISGPGGVPCEIVADKDGRPAMRPLGMAMDEIPKSDEHKHTVVVMQQDGLRTSEEFAQKPSRTRVAKGTRGSAGKGAKGSKAASRGGGGKGGAKGHRVA